MIYFYYGKPPLTGKLCDGLKAPTNSFFNVILACYEIFELEFKKIAHVKNIRRYLFHLLNAFILKQFPSFFLDSCSEHRDFILELFPAMSSTTLGWILVIFAAAFEFLGVIGLKKYSEEKNLLNGFYYLLGFGSAFAFLYFAFDYLHRMISVY